MGIYIYMFGSQFVDFLGRIVRCGLVGRGGSLMVGFEVSKTHARLNLTLFLLPACRSGYKLSVMAPAPSLPAPTMISHSDGHKLILI